MDKVKIINRSDLLDDLGERIFFQALSGSTRELATVVSGLLSELFRRVDALEQEIQSLK